MITLGVECTSHTLGIGIVSDGKILSNIHDIYRPKNEGIVPRKAADHHSEVFARVLEENLEKSRIKMKEIDLIAFSQGPGIGAPLSAGFGGAGYLAGIYKKKIIGVNHAQAHMEISAYMTGLKNSLFLYVSGGNTQLIIKENGWPRILGETLDIGIGNLFDSFGRVIGMEYAHGSALEKLAEKGSYIPLPYTVKGMNLVFSGILTEAEKIARKEHQKKHQKKHYADVAYSLMETAFAMTCEAAERALFLTKKKSLIVCGGVAQNRRLQQMLNIICHDDGVSFGVAGDEFNRDNGAMIALAGEKIYKKYGTKPLAYWYPIPRYRIEKTKEINQRNIGKK